MCNDNNGNSFLSMLTGIAVGLGIGMLMAPEKGTDMRKKIKQGFDDTTSDLKSKIADMTDELHYRTLEAKGTLEDNVEYLMSKSSYKADEVIDVLEKKLTELKNANDNLQQ